MGENVKTSEKHPSADAFREQIRRTESDITETVHALEQRLSPRYLRQRGVRKAKRITWRGTAKMLDLAQRTSVQVSLIGAGAGAMWLLLIRNRKAHVIKTAATRPAILAGAAKAVKASALWMLIRKGMKSKARARKPAVSGIAFAATAAKAFLGGARATKKTGTTRPGKKEAWRGIATALGAILGSYWYRRKQSRA